MWSRETHLFFLQESVLLVFFLSPWSLPSLPCRGSPSQLQGEQGAAVALPWWVVGAPWPKTQLLLADRREVTHWCKWGNQTEQDSLSLCPTTSLQPLSPCTSDGHHHRHQSWMKRTGFVVNLIVLEHANYASGHLEVQHAGYESQNSFRLQDMQLDWGHTVFDCVH